MTGRDRAAGTGAFRRQLLCRRMSNVAAAWRVEWGRARDASVCCIHYNAAGAVRYGCWRGQRTDLVTAHDTALERVRLPINDPLLKTLSDPFT